MAKPVKYPIRRTARFDQETDGLIVKESKLLKVAPAVVIRILVEKALKGKKA